MYFIPLSPFRISRKERMHMNEKSQIKLWFVVCPHRFHFFTFSWLAVPLIHFTESFKSCSMTIGPWELIMENEMQSSFILINRIHYAALKCLKHRVYEISYTCQIIFKSVTKREHGKHSLRLGSEGGQHIEIMVCSVEQRGFHRDRKCYLTFLCKWKFSK